MIVIKLCRVCGSDKIDIVCKLSSSPYGDLFKTSQTEAKSLGYQNLALAICGQCDLLQLTENPDVATIYGDYLYRTTITNLLSSYYSQVTNRLILEYELKTSSTIIDIGSNDGTFLLNFKLKGFNVIGIEPTKNSAEIAEKKGVLTFNGYFDKSAYGFIIDKIEYPSLISINYTLANITDIYSVFELIIKLMNDRTVLSIITGYHPDQFAVNMFEYINHDHLYYFTIASLSNLCNIFGLKILDVTRVEHKGGSIQFIIAKNYSDWKVQSSVSQLIQREKWLNCNESDFTNQLVSRIDAISNSIKLILTNFNNKTIYGVGASISSTHLCNQLQLSNLIKYIFDDDLNKIEKFSPGSGIEVKLLSDLPTNDGSLVIILAWQHSEKLLNRLKEIGFSGQVLLPLPSPKLIYI